MSNPDSVETEESSPPLSFDGVCRLGGVRITDVAQDHLFRDYLDDAMSSLKRRNQKQIGPHLSES
jgi:hypothetical protein